MGKTRDISNKIDDIVNTFNNGEMNIIANTANKLETPVNIAGVSFDGSSSINIPFNNLSNKPNTVSGFGITDAYTKSETETKIVELSPPTDLSSYYTKTQTDTAIANVVNSAPTTLDTLNELAAALGDDPNFATTVATNIGNVSSNVNTHIVNTSNPHSVTQTQVGLSNVENKSSATIRGEITSNNVTTALGFTPLSTTGIAYDSDRLGGQKIDYYQPASTAITTSNIGSQSVSYATSSGSSSTSTTATTANALNTSNNYRMNSLGVGTAATGTAGEIVASGNITGLKVYNAVFNDIADFLEVEKEIDIVYGKCYIRENEEVSLSNKYCQKGIIGIATDTYGYGLGKKDIGNKEIPIAVAGFVLAYCDKIYESGTPLTSTENGCLTEMDRQTVSIYPERIIGTFYKEEKQELWNDIIVNGRQWVKIK